jgi:hypothetical protein
MTRSMTWNPLNQIPLGRRSSTTSQRRIWIIYNKSKEHLDGLRQDGGEFGSFITSQRRVWIVYFKSEKDQPASIEWFPSPPTYSNFSNNANLGRAGQGIRRALVLQATQLSLPFLRLHLGRAGQAIGRALVLQATWHSPPFLCLHIGRAG